MQNDVSSAAGGLADIEIANVPFVKLKSFPGILPGDCFDFVEIAQMAGGKIVQAHHALIELQQSFEQMRTDKSRNSGDQPRSWLGGQGLFCFVVNTHSVFCEANGARIMAELQGSRKQFCSGDSVSVCEAVFEATKSSS